MFYMPILSTGTNVSSFKGIAGSYQDNLEGTCQYQLTSTSQSRRFLIILNRSLIFVMEIPSEMHTQKVKE